MLWRNIYQEKMEHIFPKHKTQILFMPLRNYNRVLFNLQHSKQLYNNGNEFNHAHENESQRIHSFL